MAGDERSEEPADRSPSQAFALLGNEHRVAILEALLVLHRTREEYPASFSTLRRTAGMDVSAQFNYHLDELTGHYLRRTDEGYEFRVAGWELATSILAGVYAAGGHHDEFSVGGSCPLCHSDELAVAYRDEWLGIECRGCERVLTLFSIPPGSLADRSREAFLDVFDRYVRTRVRLARDGVCPSCLGTMHPVVRAVASEKTAGRPAGYWCDRCGNRYYFPLGMYLLERPVVREFYRTRGVDVESKPYWEFRLCVDPGLSTVVSETPWRCEVRVPQDDTLLVELDEMLSITTTTIEREATSERS